VLSGGKVMQTGDSVPGETTSIVTDHAPT
jgi:hypothetical protein